MSYIKRNFLKYREHKFKKKFVNFNKYTKEAFLIKTDEDFNKLLFKYANEIAGENKKNIKSVSLEDIYRVVSKIRKKTPKFLRKITLFQIVNFKKIISDLFDIREIIKIINLSPISLISLSLRKFFGKRIEYVLKIYIASLIFQELYGEDKSRQKPKTLFSKYKSLIDRKFFNLRVFLKMNGRLR